MTGAIRTVNERSVAASPQVVLRYAMRVESWPRLLSHYRYVRVLGECEGERVVAMGARRTGIPVRWTAVQAVDPETLRVTYRHIGGVTRGMWVVWQIEPEAAGVRVTISHELQPSRWWLRFRWSQWIVGRFFVEDIADRTLAGIARAAERQGARV